MQASSTPRPRSIAAASGIPGRQRRVTRERARPAAPDPCAGRAGEAVGFSACRTIGFTFQRACSVIPGRCAASNPESRDSGSGPSDHPGMTEDINARNPPAARRARGYPPSRPSKNEGRRESRVLAVPAVLRASCRSKSARKHTGPAEALRLSLRNGLTAYAVLAPATNSVLVTVAGGLGLIDPVGPTSPPPA